MGQEQTCQDDDLWYVVVTAMKNMFNNERPKQINIRLQFYQSTCVDFCPNFTVEPFSYYLKNDVDFSKILLTIIGCVGFIFAFQIIKNVWFIYSFIGFFVGGILWLYSMQKIVKQLAKLNTHLKYKAIMCLLPSLVGTSYGIANHFLVFFIGSICCCFLMGLIATYWYGQPTERSVNMVGHSLRLFGCVTIVYAQSDCFVCIIFVLVFIIALTACKESKFASIVSEILKQLFKKQTDSCNQSAQTKLATTTSLPKQASFFCKAPLLSIEQFELQYMETPKYLASTAEFIRNNPLVIRKFKPRNRAKIALFSLDPTCYQEFSEPESSMDDENEIYCNDNDDDQEENE